MQVTIRQFAEKINICGQVLFDEPMDRHTTFKVGGPADCMVIPTNSEEVKQTLDEAHRAGLPVFVLGGGANILVSDAGIRGVVMDMSGLKGITVSPPDATGTVLFGVGAGLPISDASAAAADSGLGGLDFIYSMPGSVGGALWMNARCYDSEISEVLESADLIDAQGNSIHFLPGSADWAYKRSPFQNRRLAILRATFRLVLGDSSALWVRMREVQADRERKGHFAAPCAGSVFKNNREFGAPSGVIIDSVGLRGRVEGGAKVSDTHANIIINTGTATASDIRRLMDIVRTRVQAERGFLLEPEVILVGDWD